MKKAVFLMVSLLLTFTLITRGFALPVNAEQTTTLNPIADAYVSSAEGELSSNFGGKSYLQVANSGNMFTGECLGFLKFDIADVLSDATINSAKLELHTSVYVTSTHTIRVHYCSDDSWTELGITYENRPSFTSTITDSVVVASTDKWYEWGITSDVQTAVESDRKLTLVLSSDYHEGADRVWFYSKDQEYSWMEEYKPKLTVSYQAEGKSTDLTSAIIGGIILLAIVGGIAFGVYKLIKRRKQKTEELEKRVLIRKIVGTIIGGFLILFGLLVLGWALTLPVIVSTAPLLLSIMLLTPGCLVLWWAFKKKQPTKPEEQIRRICPYCGRVLKEDTKFCPYCGKKLSEIEES